MLVFCGVTVAYDAHVALGGQRVGGHEGTWRCFKGQRVDDAEAAVGVCGVCGHFDGVVGVFLGREGGQGAE